MNLIMLVILTLNLVSCGGSKGSNSSSPIQGHPPINEEYTASENKWARILKECGDSFITLDQDLGFLQMGYLGHNCLNEKSFARLKTILATYEKHKQGLSVNWNALARITLKMD